MYSGAVRVFQVYVVGSWVWDIAVIQSLTSLKDYFKRLKWFSFNYCPSSLMQNISIR